MIRAVKGVTLNRDFAVQSDTAIKQQAVQSGLWEIAGRWTSSLYGIEMIYFCAFGPPDSHFIGTQVIHYCGIRV